MDEKQLKKELAIMIFLVVGLFAVFLFRGINVTGASTFVLNPGSGDDSYIDQQIQGTNYGTDTLLFTGYGGQGQRFNSLYHMNLSGVPSGSTILSAKFEVYVVDMAGTNVPVHVHRLTKNWTESGVNWNKTQADGQNNWTTLGGDYYSGFDSNVSLNSTGWYNFTITKIVKGFVNGSYTDYGIILVADNVSDYKGIRSKEHANYPRLHIEYTPNVEPNITSLTSTALVDEGGTITWTIGWDDLEGNNAQFFICNSTSASSSGCTEGTFCNTSWVTYHNAVSCNYASAYNNTHNNSFYIYACDSVGTCGFSRNGTFIVNHRPNVTVVNPNGGEDINETTYGLYAINASVYDYDNNTLNVSFYYSTGAGAKQYFITSFYSNATNCNQGNLNETGAVNCTYLWNTSAIGGTYYLDVQVNDTKLSQIDSSNANFRVTSIVDETNPLIDNRSITANLTNGKTAIVRASIVESNLLRAYFTINNTVTQVTSNYSMSFSDGTYYNGTFEAGATGNYSYKIFVDDSYNNHNYTTSWIVFNVTDTNASVGSEIYPTKALPSSTVYISGVINATYQLRNVQAYLNTPSGFVFLTDYPQNNSLHNISQGNSNTTNWFVATPTIESYYLLNISYNDKYGNSWQGNNFNINVTDDMGGGGTTDLSGIFTVDINSVSEVVASTANAYNAEILVRNATGAYVNATAVAVWVQDPVGNMYGGLTTTQINTGIYNFTYTPGSTAGDWKTIVNVTYNGVVQQDRQYWSVISTLFDVREVTVRDNTTSTLNISVILENIGSSAEDIAVNWNLTVESNGTVLGSGTDTIGVAAGATKFHSFTPVTNFIGQVRISVIGYYPATSQTEKAGAYLIFYTQPENVSVPGPSPGVSTSGGVTTIQKEVAKAASLKFLEYQDKLEFKAGESKEVVLVVKNDGSLNLNKMYLILDGIDKSWYNVKPNLVDMSINDMKTFIINLTVPYDVEKTKTYGFDYNVKNNEGQSFKKSGEIKVYSIKDSLLKDIEELEREIATLKYTIKDAEERGVYVGRAKTILGMAEEKTGLAKDEVKDDKFDLAREDIDSARRYIQDVKDELITLGIPVLEAPKPGFFGKYWVWIVSWILVGLLVILFVLMYLHVSRIQGIEYKSGSKEKLSREIKLMNVKLGMIDNDLKKGELNRKLYDTRKQEILDSLKNLKMELEGENTDDREPLYVKEARKAIKQAKYLGYKEDDIIDKFVKKGWNKETVLRLYQEDFA